VHALFELAARGCLKLESQVLPLPEAGKTNHLQVRNAVLAYMKVATSGQEKE
jgi:hypothetical protein